MNYTINSSTDGDINRMGINKIHCGDALVMLLTIFEQMEGEE